MGQPAGVKHGMADVKPGVRLHYLDAGTGERTMVLLHGYPQTSYAWRHVIAPLVQAGYRVIVPDYRGSGGSTKPPDGYDKRTMALDLALLLGEHLRVRRPVVLVGHDIGMMVAYAFASSFPKSVERLVLMEAPLPGTLTYQATITTTHLSNFMPWHFFFHNASNHLAELLTQGRERQYLKHFLIGWRSIRMRSGRRIWQFTAHSTRRQGRCGPGSSFTGRLIGTPTTTARP